MKTLRQEIDERARPRAASHLDLRRFRRSEEWKTGGSVPVLQ